jgi:hypothetical protein
MKKIVYFFKTAIIIIFLSACSSTSKVATTTPEPETKAVALPEGKALVYIVRPKFMGSVINFKVTINGKYIGFTKGKSYIYSIVDPGKVNILSEAENTEELQLVTEANKKYYIEQIPQMGIIKARNKMEVITDPVQGEEKLAKCNLSKGFEQSAIK